MQKEKIKNVIKRTKLTEKAKDAHSHPHHPHSHHPHHHIGGPLSPPVPGLSHSLPTSATYSDSAGRTRATSEDSQSSFDFGASLDPSFDVYHHQPSALYAPPLEAHLAHHDPTFAAHHLAYPSYPGDAPYAVDIKTERQMFVNDVPLRRDSTVSTFSTFQPPPPPHAGGLGPVPAAADWMPEDLFTPPAGEHVFDSVPEEDEEASLGMDVFDFGAPPPPAQQQQQQQEATIQVDECERPLLEHFVDHVLRLIFPMLEGHRHGTVRAQVVLPALERNKTYLHACLSTAAIHLKATGTPSPAAQSAEQLDSAIMRHRYATVAELCEALNRDTDHAHILEATLAMISLPCAVGRPDDGLPDIPWHQHFEAAASLARRLDLPGHLAGTAAPDHHPAAECATLPFNTTLTAWIDILGATMLGRAPLFADAYRDAHLRGAPAGLRALTGCEDRALYLVSEIACLEALQRAAALDPTQLCAHIALLGQQLDGVEADADAAAALHHHRSSAATGGATAVTHLFVRAARLYLLGLVPGARKTDLSTRRVVDDFVAWLERVPAGAAGPDRGLVWPLLVAGSMSVPGDRFRAALAARVARLGDAGKHGSFGRMVRLLQEVWQRSEESGCDVHWRDVMRDMGWDFLLI